MITKWFSILLNDRFGHVFIIEEKSNILEISLPGHNNKIVFKNKINHFRCVNNNFGCSEWGGSSSLLAKNKKALPAPGLEQNINDLISINNNNTIISYDILGFCYWAMNRLEEIDSHYCDNNGRFNHEFSHAYKYKYLDRPLVDEWLEILREAIEITWPNIPLKVHKFNIDLSHDVDLPSRYLDVPLMKLILRGLKDIIKYKNLKLIETIISTRYNKRVLSSSDPYNNFKWLIDKCHEYKITSTYFFVADRTSKFDPHYSINKPHILELILYIINRKQKLGLHPSYITFDNIDQLRREKNILESVLMKYNINLLDSRNHYLRWSHPQSLQQLNDVGIKCDHSLGYPRMTGFRCGTSFEFSGYNHITNRLLDIKIKPLIVMDQSLFNKNYMSLSFEKAEKQIYGYIDKIKEVKGSFTTLWHNNYFESIKYKNLLNNILNYAIKVQ